jgi:hypothetical protein
MRVLFLLSKSQPPSSGLRMTCMMPALVLHRAADPFRPRWMPANDVVLGATRHYGAAGKDVAERQDGRTDMGWLSRWRARRRVMGEAHRHLTQDKMLRTLPRNQQRELLILRKVFAHEKMGQWSERATLYVLA